MRLRAFRIKGQRVIQCRFGFGQVSFTNRHHRVRHFNVRVVLLGEFLQLLFCRLVLLRGNRCLRQKGKSWSVVRRLLQNLGRFLECIIWLAYSEIDQGKLVAIVQILGSELARFQEERRRPQGRAFVRPHCPATSVGNGIIWINLQDF